MAKRANPSLSTWLLLAGAGAGAYYVWLKPKIEAQQAARAAAGAPAKKSIWGELTDVMSAVYAAKQKSDAEAAQEKTRYQWTLTVYGQRVCKDTVRNVYVGPNSCEAALLEGCAGCGCC